jgi:hypothetical protein
MIAPADLQVERALNQKVVVMSHTASTKSIATSTKAKNKGRRNKRKRAWYPEPALVRKRVAEMNRAFECSFPEQRLPNNGLGRKWARYMMRTKRLYPGPLDYLWLKSWCPWMSESDQDEILGLKGHWYTTGSLGARLQIDNAMRKDKRLWTMRPDDVPWEQVQLEKGQREYMQKQVKRHAMGVKPRRKGAAEPWKALDMKKGTYYRKKLHLVHETPESALTYPVGTADSQVSLRSSAVVSTGEVSILPPQEPTAQSKPQDVVVSLAEYLARHKAAIQERRKGTSVPTALPEARAA